MLARRREIVRSACTKDVMATVGITNGDDDGISTCRYSKAPPDRLDGGEEMSIAVQDVAGVSALAIDGLSVSVDLQYWYRMSSLCLVLPRQWPRYLN